jgi:hypothetical protein
VQAASASDDASLRWLAWHVAPHVGADLWEDAFAMLERGPLDDGLVYRLMAVEDHERRRRVIAWAEKALPLSEIATGPDRHLFAQGDQGVVDGALTFVLQAMDDPELYSEPLVAAGLRAPVISTRNMACNALEVRPREEWGTSVEDALARSAVDDPDEDVRARVGALAS